MPRKPKRNLRTSLVPRLAGLTRFAPTPLLLASRKPLALALASVPGWRSRVRGAMTAALGPDGFEARHVDQYFRHLADLFVYSAAVYRSGLRGAGLDGEWLHDPASAERYRQALAGGKGALLVCPHLIAHEIMAGSAAAELPITVLVRKSPEPEYEAVKQRWYAAVGVEVAYRPPKGSQLQSLGEMTAALRVLRKNRVLAITPDLVQKPGTGIPVTLFGRTVELPAGAFFLAVRTGAPLLPSFFHREGDRYRLWTHDPLPINSELERDAAVADAAQQWATLFEQFIREHPDMWQFWLDKRWLKVFGVEG
ncbi:MAG: lipid biosynthesis acyltransferase [Armatimonadetes bacterium]|jgi:lauroyl/myristoyl acyltransferase|nr:lipid biosynthesis acyltransferase [Armatimonadota bacterium]